MDPTPQRSLGDPGSPCLPCPPPWVSWSKQRHRSGLPAERGTGTWTDRAKAPTSCDFAVPAGESPARSVAGGYTAAASFHPHCRRLLRSQCHPDNRETRVPKTPLRRRSVLVRFILDICAVGSVSRFARWEDHLHCVLHSGDARLKVLPVQIVGAAASFPGASLRQSCSPLRCGCVSNDLVQMSGSHCSVPFLQLRVIETHSKPVTWSPERPRRRLARRSAQMREMQGGTPPPMGQRAGPVIQSTLA